ncbi:MAG: amidohydrolase family protein [Oscillospiraceae bacterium]|jgi:predicted TIM-barrel fold metal-dependent hydrolase|nr:amidohydrolase family protein [Oscillospiraceae bacterium]
MRRIIDAHAHLGDIFHENRNVSFKTNVKKGDYEDRFIELEESLFEKPLFTGDPRDLQLVIDGGQFRCWEATLENTARQMDACEMAGIVLLPVLPNTTFEEYLAASKLEPRLIPFTAADMTLPPDEMTAKLRRDIGRGAKGLKLHPVLQNVRLTDDRMAAAAEVFAAADLPVVVHVGEGTYYSEDKNYPVNSKYGAMADFFSFARARKDQVLVAAHCAAYADALMEGCRGLENVYADTSFCSVGLARKAVDIMGADRVLFGTDYPFVNERFCIEVIERAFEDDPITKDKIFYGNIARLLHL